MDGENTQKRGNLRVFVYVFVCVLCGEASVYVHTIFLYAREECFLRYLPFLNCVDGEGERDGESIDMYRRGGG